MARCYHGRRFPNFKGIMVIVITGIMILINSFVSESANVELPWREPESTIDLNRASIIASEKFQTLDGAFKIQGAIKEKFGITIPVKDIDKLPYDTWSSTEAWQETLILMGSLESNRAMGRLYGMRLIYADGFFPGEGGWILQTIMDPFGNGSHIIVLGASNGEGIDAVTDEFIGDVESLSGPIFPWTIKASIRGEANKALQYGAKLSAGSRTQLISKGMNTLANLTPDGVNQFFITLAQAGEGYLLTGDKEYALAFKELALAMEEYIRREPSKSVTLISDSRNMWSWGPRVFSIWHAIEPSPIFNSEDRINITTMLYKLAQINREDGYLAPMFTPSVRWNHQIYPGLSLFYAANYFATYYPNQETFLWRSLAEATFEKNTSYIGLDEGSDYIFHVPEKVLDYAMATGKDSLFLEGIKAAADLYVIFIDNLGVMGGGGDTYPLGYSSAFSWGHSKVMWMASWYLEDPIYAGMLEKVRTSPISQRQPDWDNPLHSYITRVPKSIPQIYPPVSWVRIDKGLYDEVQRPSSTAYYGKTTEVPIEETFHKLSLREGFGIEDQYLLLDGFSGGRHGHETGNSILSLNHGGRLWLADKDYIRIYPDSSNGLVVVKDGAVEKKDPFTSLQSTVDLNDFSFTRTLLPSYNGVDWYRNILWKRGSFFLVVDEVNVKEDGSYVFENLWHGMGQAMLLDGHDLKLTQDGEREFHIVSLDDSTKRLRERDKHTRKYWAEYPYTKAPITLLREIKMGQYIEGDEITYLNLLIGDEPYSVIRVGERSALITVGHDQYLMGTSGFASDYLKTDARIFVIDKRQAYLVGMKNFHLASGNIQVKADGEVDLFLDLEKGIVKTNDSGVKVVVYGKLKGEPSHMEDILMAFKSQAYEGDRAIPEREVSPLNVTKMKGIEGTISAFAVGDLNKDGAEEVVIGTRAGMIAAISQNGEVLWQYGKAEGFFSRLLSGPTVPGWINHIYIDDLEGNGELTVLATSEDWNLYALNGKGKLLWKRTFPSSSQYAERKGSLVGATAITTAKVPGEKNKVIYVGTQFRYVYSLTSKGVERWNEPLQWYGVNDLAAGDLSGDGYHEVAAALEYYYLSTIKDKRAYRERGVVVPGWTKVAVIDLEGQGRSDVLAGTAGGLLLRYTSNGLGGYFRWRMNIGGEVTSILGADINGDGKPEVLAGGHGFHVYAIEGDGNLLWKMPVPDVIKTMAVMGTRVYVGLENGKVMAFSWAGELMGETTLDSCVMGMAQVKDLRGEAGLVMATEGGSIYKIQ